MFIQAKSIEIKVVPSLNNSTTASVSKPVEMIDGKVRATNVDRISRKLFPVSFLCFNLFYWTYYGLHSLN